MNTPLLEGLESGKLRGTQSRGGKRLPYPRKNTREKRIIGRFQKKPQLTGIKDGGKGGQGLDKPVCSRKLRSSSGWTSDASIGKAKSSRKFNSELIESQAI